MTIVGLRRISAAFSLLAAVATTPAQAQAYRGANQATANAVAGALRTSAGLSASRIEIETRSGVVTLSGAVSSPALKAEAIARAQQVPGVVAVADHLRIANDSRVRPAAYEEVQPTQVALGHHHGGGLFGRGGGGDDGAMIGDGTTMGAPTDDTAGTAGADAAGGPLPEGPAGVVGGAQTALPGYPNYAWPSYAPYPNFSAVGYPLVYPWQAWPNIGPFYPYPEVPLDWRAVTARYHDGLWYVKFRKNYTRPFFTPYPFGIMAY